MTKADVRAKLNMICNLTAQIIALKNELTGIDACDDGLFDELDDLCDGIDSGAEAWEKLKDYYNELDEGEDTGNYPSVIVDPATLWTKLIQPVPGGSLIAETCGSDYDTRQMVLEYETDGCIAQDLALAEVKQGELAVIDGKAKDNEDVDVYTYTDAYSEDWQGRFTIKRSDVEKSRNA